MVEQVQHNEDRHRDIEACLPQLRAFALFLTRDRTMADDLVQEAVTRALSHIDQFVPNTNFKAWITTILRNAYYNDIRPRRQMISDSDPNVSFPETAVSGGQEARIQMRDFERAFGKLQSTSREALLLVGANGFSYEEAAEIAGCAVGTMKSRVSRARAQLLSYLDPERLDQRAAA
jgi:RNA polymerase sigma-70 factor (ECF subfamily)